MSAHTLAKAKPATSRGNLVTLLAVVSITALLYFYGGAILASPTAQAVEHTTGGLLKDLKPSAPSASIREHKVAGGGISADAQNLGSFQKKQPKQQVHTYYTYGG